MTNSLSFLASGVFLGLIAGISPGPIFTLVISETLKHGKKEGFKISIVPLLTDLPIVLVTIFVLSRFTHFNTALGIISLLGSLFLLWLAYESLTFKGMKVNFENRKVQSIKKGMLTNFLNPSPYLFWFSVGAPTVLKAYTESALSAFFYIGGFYLLLVGSKVVITLLIDKTKSFLNNKVYLYTIRFLGVVLIIFAVLFFTDGLKYFGILH